MLVKRIQGHRDTPPGMFFAHLRLRNPGVVLWPEWGFGARRLALRVLSAATCFLVYSVMSRVDGGA
jgi:hypothetical protein